MDIDRLAAQVAASVQPQADAARFGKDAARRTIRAINAQWRNTKCIG